MAHRIIYLQQVKISPDDIMLLKLVACIIVKAEHLVATQYENYFETPTSLQDLTHH